MLSTLLMQFKNAFATTNKSHSFSLPFHISPTQLSIHAQLPFSQHAAKLHAAFPHLAPSFIGKSVSKVKESERDVLRAEEEVYGEGYGRLAMLAVKLELITAGQDEKCEEGGSDNAEGLGEGVDERKCIEGDGGVRVFVKDPMLRVASKHMPRDASDQIQPDDTRDGENLSIKEKKEKCGIVKVVTAICGEAQEAAVFEPNSGNMYAKAVNPYLTCMQVVGVFENSVQEAGTRTVIKNSVVRVKSGSTPPMNVVFEGCDFVFE